MNNLIIQHVSRLIIPFIQLYGLFVVINGHLSPGGAFPGGAIIAASVILYSLAFGSTQGRKKIPHHVAKLFESGAILVFLGLGLAGIFTENSFLTNKEAGFYMGEAGNIVSAGFIPIITVALGIKVASTICTLFFAIIEEEPEH